MSHYTPQNACVIVFQTKQYVNPCYPMNIQEINEGLNSLLSGQYRFVNNKELLWHYKNGINYDKERPAY